MGKRAASEGVSLNQLAATLLAQGSPNDKFAGCSQHDGVRTTAVGAAEAAQVRGIRIQEKGAAGAAHGGGVDIISIYRQF